MSAEARKELERRLARAEDALAALLILDCAASRHFLAI